MIRVLFDGHGEHSYYQVVDRIYNQRPARLLLAGSATPQSGLAQDDDPELLFDYNQRFLEIAQSLDPQSILVIGGGAFTLPKALMEYLPATRIDVIEIEPILLNLAREYFELPDSSRLRVVTGDGREYINSCQAQYDLIIVDAFAEYDIPRQLITTQAVAHYARLLSPHGVLAMNLISKYHGTRPELAHQLLATFRTAFESPELYPADAAYSQRIEQNYLLVASHAQAPGLDYLQSLAVRPIEISEEQLRLSDS